MMFAPYSRAIDTEEKKDVFAPVADLMVGVVFIFIIMVLALSLLMIDDIDEAVPKTVHDAVVAQLFAEKARFEAERADREEAARRKLAEFVRHMRDSGVDPILGRIAKADKRRTEILEKLRDRLRASKFKVEIDAE